MVDGKRQRGRRWTPAQETAAFYFSPGGGFWSLPEIYRRAHAQYVRLRKAGKTRDEMLRNQQLRRIVRQEQVYQAAREFARLLREGRDPLARLRLGKGK